MRTADQGCGVYPKHPTPTSWFLMTLIGLCAYRYDLPHALIMCCAFPCFIYDHCKVANLVSLGVWLGCTDAQNFRLSTYRHWQMLPCHFILILYWRNSPVDSRIRNYRDMLTRKLLIVLFVYILFMLFCILMASPMFMFNINEDQNNKQEKRRKRTATETRNQTKGAVVQKAVAPRYII